MGTDGSDDVDPALLDEALSHPIRREIVDRLLEEEGAGLKYLALTVRRKEAERLGSSITEFGYHEMVKALTDTHLPLLAEAGVIHYDRRTEWIKLHEQFDDSHGRLEGK